MRTTGLKSLQDFEKAIQLLTDELERCREEAWTGYFINEAQDDVQRLIYLLTNELEKYKAASAIEDLSDLQVVKSLLETLITVREGAYSVNPIIV